MSIWLKYKYHQDIIFIADELRKKIEKQYGLTMILTVPTTGDYVDIMMMQLNAYRQGTN